MKLPVTLCLLLGTSVALAQPADLQPPTLPDAYRGERIEPEVTIVETDEAVIYEYRVGEQLYMVRVDPIVGKPYYLLDTDGDGQLDVRRDSPFNNSVNQWRLLEW